MKFAAAESETGGRGPYTHKHAILFFPTKNAKSCGPTSLIFCMSWTLKQAGNGCEQLPTLIPMTSFLLASQRMDNGWQSLAKIIDNSAAKF